jgi:tryptophan synthase beta subunit
MAGTLPADTIVVINLSGRGDKDCMEVARLREELSKAKETK